MAVFILKSKRRVRLFGLLQFALPMHCKGMLRGVFFRSFHIIIITFGYDYRKKPQ